MALHFFFFLSTRNQNKLGKIKGWKRKEKKKIVAQGTKESDEGRMRPGCKGDNFEKIEGKAKKKNIWSLHKKNFVHTGSPTFSLQFSSNFKEIIFWWIRGKNA